MIRHPQPQPKKPRRRHICRALPYGHWTEADGSDVFFDRRYRPLCRRRPNGAVELVAPDAWIAWEQQAWFYSDKNQPIRSKATLRRLERIVDELGIIAEVMDRSAIYANPVWKPPLRYQPMAQIYHEQTE